MDLAALRKSFGECTPEEITSGCNALDPRIDSYEAACQWLWIIIRRLLDANKYRAAALILFGPDLFDSRPQGVSRILNAIQSNAKVIILGSASSGKSYSIAAYCILDWLRDPSATSIRVISTTKGHAKKNTFSSILRLYNEALIPLPGICQTEYVGLDTHDRHAGITMIAIPEGQDGKNTLQGFHPVRRSKPHPTLGPLSRIRVFVDESEMVSNTVFKGLGNISSNLEGIETVKIILACNPWNPASMTANNAEPPRGWNAVNPDRDFEWTSKMGYKVVRVDAKFSENVVQKKQVYPGLMSHDGYIEKLNKTGGNDPEFWTYGRGMYSLDGSVDQLIPLSYLNDWIGTFNFLPEKVYGCAGVDLAWDGGDLVIFFAGRCGRARSWRTPNGEIRELEEPTFVVQLDSWVSLPKTKTEAQFNQIMDKCRAFGIDMDYVGIDATGSGKGCADLFWERGFRGVLPISWGAGSTNTKLREQDRSACNETISGIAAEMWFCLRSWLEVGAIKVSPFMDLEKITQQLIGRRREAAGLGPTGLPCFRLEQKSKFRSRMGVSPDHVDAMAMCVHAARIRSGEKASLTKDKKAIATAIYESDPCNVVYLDFSSE
jgi:hypothetical protein